MAVTNIDCTIANQVNLPDGTILDKTLTINNYGVQPALLDRSAPIDFHVPRAVSSFRGRDAELQRLTSWFLGERRRRAVIGGLPGYGKTELAKQFVRRCRAERAVQHVLWMNAETPEKLMADFASLARLIGMPEVDEESKVQMVYKYFDETTSIFVFDNAQNRSTVCEFEPPVGCSCLLLATSHVKDWGDDYASLELWALAPGPAVEVVQSVLGNRYRPGDYALYVDLAEVLSYVPLALQLAVAYVRQEIIEKGEGFDLKEHIKELRNSQDEFVDKSFPGFSANLYKNSITKSIMRSLQKIEQSSNKHAKLALNILHICVYLYSENIGFPDLLNIQYIKTLLENRPDKDLNRAASLLNNYSFINFFDDQITMHRLVQETLIYHQTNQSLHYFYTGCLEYTLSEVSKIHQYTIISHADKKTDTFFEFYLKYKELFLSDDLYLRNLILSGCTASLLRLFKDSPRFNETINQFYLLNEAAASRQHDALQLLLDNGAEINKPTPDNETAIFEAALKLDLYAVQVLTNAGAELNIESRWGDTILHSIITVSGPPWSDSLQDTAMHLIKWVIEQGASPNAVNSRLKSTLLHYAALALRPNIIEFLINEYALDVNAQNALGRIPLHTVSDASKQWYLDKERRVETAKCLLKYGSRLDVIDRLNRTPIEHAREEKFEYLAKFLENPEEYDANIVNTINPN